MDCQHSPPPATSSSIFLTANAEGRPWASHWLTKGGRRREVPQFNVFLEGLISRKRTWSRPGLWHFHWPCTPCTRSKKKWKRAKQNKKHALTKTERQTSYLSLLNIHSSSPRYLTHSVSMKSYLRAGHRHKTDGRQMMDIRGCFSCGDMEGWQRQLGRKLLSIIGKISFLHSL